MGLPHGLWCPPPEPPVPKGTRTPLHLRAGPAGPVQAGSTCSGPQLCTPCCSLTWPHHGREEQRPAQPSAHPGHGEERPEPVPQGALGRPCPQTFRRVSICRSIGRFAAGAGPGLTFINAPAPPAVLTACLSASHPHHPAGSPGTAKEVVGSQGQQGIPWWLRQ